jgi:ATP-dependent Clp protease ATP-binding subunit ClpC
MNELYELCKSINGFLTYENAQKLADDDSAQPTEQRESEGRQLPYRMAGMGAAAEREKKNKKKFRDVPKEDLLRLADNMKVHLIGQDEAVENLADAIQRASIGLKDPNKPIGSFLFSGRTGVGKTLATKILADELIKGKDNLVTVDCSEYSADHEYSKLIGAPAGYIGHEQGGYLTNAVSKTPFCAVVFDEVEKASSKVHELMLQILEEGRLTDGRGQMVSFKDTVIIMTSNIGAKEIEGISKTIGFGDVSKITDEKKDVALNEALKKKFKPEFLNRIDAIINFRTLGKEDYMRIIDIELYKLNDNLRRNETEYKDLSLKFDKSVKDYIYKNGIDENYGARPLKRCIEKDISTPLARKILSESIDPASIVQVKAFKEKIRFSIKSKEEACIYATDEYKAQTDACEE